MKKLMLTTVCLLMGLMSTWASIWTPKTVENGDFYEEKPYWVNLTVSGTPTMAPTVELAAFIDGDCRALAVMPDEYGRYVLRVAGDFSEGKDLGKDIVFKAFVADENEYSLPRTLVYEFTKKGKFDNPDGVFSFNLTLDLLKRIVVDTSITIEATLPTTYDLSQHIHFQYGDSESPTSSNVTLDTELTYQWTVDEMTTAENSCVESINGNILTTKNKETTEKAESLTVHIEGLPYHDVWSGMDYQKFEFMASVELYIYRVKTPVTSISIPAEVEAYVGDNIKDILTGIKGKATVLPADASNKELIWGFNDNTSWFTPDSIISERGEYTVTFSSVSDPGVTADIKVIVKQHPSFTIPSVVKLSLLGDSTMTFTNFSDPDGLFDPSLVEIDDKDPMFKATLAADGKSCTMRGLYTGVTRFRVFYDGRPMQTDSPTESSSVCQVDIEAMMALPTNGWGWVSACYLPMNEEDQWIPLKNMDGSLADFMNNVIEMRTQVGLLYNDNGTLYGNISYMDGKEGMYKVRGTNVASNIVNLGTGVAPLAKPDGNVYALPLRKGYTWLTYPYEFDLELTELPGLATAHEGDLIIGQTSAATYSGSQWVTNGFKFEAGKGYVYYSSSDETNSVTFQFEGTPNCYQEAPAGARMMAFHPWKLQNQGFADNMVGLVRIKGLAHPENYMIGAFVGDECRGEGSVVKGDVMMLCVAGKGGEKVSFRLFDKETEEEIELNETVSYTQMMGSIKMPREFTPTVVTGITNRTAVKADNNAVYTISGQKLASPRKGINIIDGKKVIR